MSEATVERLARAQITAPSELLAFDFDDASATAPRGFERLAESALLRRSDLDAVGVELLSWGLQLGSGMTVRVSDVPLREGTIVLLGLGVGRVRLPIPCRVTEVIDEPHRRGFVYATLPGHPECGVECFLVERRGDDVWVSIDSLSRPGWLLTRIGAPVMRWAQRWMTRRYLRALAR
ncbi:DUF1990 domain-containing protein [Dermacoccus barathri]|uniref:DUF1990 domain-containing protein n=1 Tax=Dermacoccus abyssi TaxID=322596 RepID=A0ABX5ZFP4_9MICO|nr:DUF1990 domain-containing protein [Dermacoccus barathri]QEH94544.1 DUF1990 domain-containing protein [Dermacoccus abyssi]